MIENLDEHKLCVEYIPTNEQVLNKTRMYPRTRWYTVISVPDDAPHQMKTDLNKQMYHFKNLHNRKLKISLRRHFTDYFFTRGEDIPTDSNYNWATIKIRS